MSVGLLIVSHGKLGDYLLETATQMLSICPLATDVLPVSFDCDPDTMIQLAIEKVEKLNDGNGVLILTDMYGSTPSNIVCRLQDSFNIQIVTGVNLPMLIRVLNYPRLSLNELAHKAMTGGRDGVVMCKPVPGS